MEILIIRQSAIGDIIFSSTILPYLKQAYPDSRISWFVRKYCKQVVSGFPEVDCIYTNISELLSKRFDLALDLQGLLRTSIILKIVRAKRKIGLGSKEGGQYLISEVVGRNASYQTADIDTFAHEYIYLGKYLTSNHQETLPYPSYKCQRSPYPPGYIAICPFTTRPQKFWMWENWHSLITQINKKYNLPCYILGSDQDIIPDSIYNSKELYFKDLTGKGDISWSFSVIQNAAATIAVDSGLGHFSILHHKPTVILFGSTIPYRKTDNPKCHILYHNLPCSPCGRRPICNSEYYCMRTIQANQVMKSLAVSLQECI